MWSKTQDKAVIAALVEHLGESEHPGLRIDRYPDEENRSSPDIDAIAGEFAIEHTSVDTVANQRRDDDRFMRVVRGLKDEFKARISFRLRITVCWESIQVGQDWIALRSRFKGWIRYEAGRLPDGKHKIEEAPGIPFPFWVEKQSNRPPGVFFARFAPTDTSLPQRVRKLFDEKVSKLKPYKDEGYTTVLLVESSDLALMNRSILVQAVSEAYRSGLPASVDQIWFADTSVPAHEPVFSDITRDISR